MYGVADTDTDTDTDTDIDTAMCEPCVALMGDTACYAMEMKGTVYKHLGIFLFAQQLRLAK